MKLAPEDKKTLRSLASGNWISERMLHRGGKYAGRLVRMGLATRAPGEVSETLRYALTTAGREKLAQLTG